MKERKNGERKRLGSRVEEIEQGSEGKGERKRGREKERDEIGGREGGRGVDSG